MTLILGKMEIKVGVGAAIAIALFLIANTWKLASFIGDLEHDLHDIKVAEAIHMRKDSIQDAQIARNSTVIDSSRHAIHALTASIGYFTEIRTPHGVVFKPYKR